MPTQKDICNMGLGKIGASRVNSLAPPISVLENKCASEYAHWKRSELKKRRWTFATALVTLTSNFTVDPPKPDGRSYRFDKPGDYLRAIRPKNCPWVERGNNFFSSEPTIDAFEYIRDVVDAELSDNNFVDVLAARVALECAELATQSPAKKRDALVLYKDALDEAGRLNAFILEPHETEGDEIGYTWDHARLYPDAYSGY